MARKLTEKERPGITKRRRARQAYERTVKTSKPGEGKRFEALAKAAAASGAENPEAVAAAAGRKKYGKQRMAQMAAAGRRRKG